MRNFIKPLAISALAGALALAWPAASFADDVTTTTTTQQTTESLPGIQLHVPLVGVEIGGGQQDCTRKTETRTNEDTGTTETRTKTNCE